MQNRTNGVAQGGRKLNYPLITLCLLALLSSTRGDEFSLTNANGESYGPFEFKQGGMLVLAGKGFVISRIITKDQQVVERMKKFRVPEVEFREASICCLVDFLQACARDRQKGGDAIGINIGILPPKPKAAPKQVDGFASPFAESDMDRPKDWTDKPRHQLTFSGRDLSVHDILDASCRIASCRWFVTNSFVFIEPIEQR